MQLSMSQAVESNVARVRGGGIFVCGCYELVADLFGSVKVV